MAGSYRVYAGGAVPVPFHRGARIAAGALLAGLAVLALPPGASASPLVAPSAPPALWLRLENAPFAPPGAAPNALVHVPPGLDPSRPYRVLLFFHDEARCLAALAREGHVACSGRSAEAWDLVARHAALGDSQRILVAPSMEPPSAEEGRSGAGRLGEPGVARAMIHEVLEHLEREGVQLARDRLESLTVVAEGTGFEGTLAVLRDSELPVRDAVFLDALYSGTRQLLDWLSSREHRLLSVHRGSGPTRRTSRFLLYRALLRVPGAHARSFRFGDDVGDARLLVIDARDVPFGEIAAASFDDALRALGP